MGYEVRRSAESDRDLDLIFDHLIGAYMGFGDSLTDAHQRTTRRLLQIHADLEKLGDGPHRGTRDAPMGPKLRHVTRNRAVFYFEISETDRVIQVLAIFLSGQNHQLHMLERLANPDRRDA